MAIWDKLQVAAEAKLDEIIQKAKTDAKPQDPWDRKGMIELNYQEEMQYGWKERRGLVGPGVLKNMARKNSMIAAIIQTRLSQIQAFAKPQEDKYTPGFKIKPKDPADLTEEDKLKLADPSLDEESYEELKYKLEKKRSKLQKQQKEEIEQIMEFIMHCGSSNRETDTTYRRFDFNKVLRLVTQDRLIYNYAAIELIPNKTMDKIVKFYPVSAGTIRYVSQQSADRYLKILKEEIQRRQKLAAIEGKSLNFAPPQKPFRYVQVVRGRVVAAWTEDELIFEPANPTVDPEDNGYAPGELELLLQVVTSHLYAEAHNRNFFTQGIGTKGILHIKGDNISRGQLEAFKRQWFNQLSNSRNAFRPPIIGMADEVKWVELAQSNKDMEFDNWMHYLIRMACAIYQIDPSEINFDISKVQTSTLNESNNEQKLKMSRDKGLRPLLDYIEAIINKHILPFWNKELASKYEFKFVGLQAETKTQEIERLEKEGQVYKTANEIRIEMGLPPIEDGDVLLNANFTQYKQAKLAQEQLDEQGGPGEEGQPEEEDQGFSGELDDLGGELDSIVDDVTKEMEAEDKKKADEEKAKAANSSDRAKKEVKKSSPTIVEYYTKEDDTDEE